jgi:dTDP-4-dehydrorhamnose reductase
MGKRILITGGSGLLALNWALHDRNENEVVLGINNREISLAGTHVAKLDTVSAVSIANSVSQINPDLIIHTAGLTSVEICEKNPVLAKEVNTVLAANFAEACQVLKIPMIHISTDHIFSGNNAMLTETDTIEPLNIYALTKAEAEIAVLRACPSALVVRTNFYGWGTSYRHSFSDYIIKNLREGKKITLFDDVFYTPILAEALIKATHELINKDASGIFHVVGDERVSKYQFGITVAQYFGLNAQLISRGKMKENELLVNRPKDMSLSNKKACQLLEHPLGGIHEHLIRLLEQEQSGMINEIIRL